MKYKIIDLFSGAGGLTLGFTDPRFCGGFECIYSIDNDSAAVKTHNANFGEHSLCTNIEDWLAKTPTIPETDLVIGGAHHVKALACLIRNDTAMKDVFFGNRLWMLSNNLKLKYS